MNRIKLRRNLQFTWHVSNFKTDAVDDVRAEERNV